MREISTRISHRDQGKLGSPGIYGLQPERQVLILMPRIYHFYLELIFAILIKINDGYPEFCGWVQNLILGEAEWNYHTDTGKIWPSSLQSEVLALTTQFYFCCFRHYV